jgi:FdhE protein
VESSIRARIAALAEAEPGLADDVALRGAMIEIIDAAEPPPIEIRLPADVVRARLAAGVPLLDRLDLPVPASASNLLERLTVAFLADPSTRQPAEALLTALRSHRLHAEQLVGEAIVGHDDHLTQLAESADLPYRPVIIVADLAARAFLSAVAIRLRPALALGPWDRAYCPICGGLPLLAERPSSPSPSQWGVTSTQSMFAPRSGRGVGLSLRCGRCATAWAHTLQWCPDCGTGTFDVLDVDEDWNGWTLAGCEDCPEYLKIAPSPRAERLADLMMDDVETWELDRWALDDSRQRRGGVGYRLEHGEPAGEELDDD